MTSDDTSITIVEFDATLIDGTILTLPAGSLTSLTPSTRYAVLYDTAAGTYLAAVEPATTELANSNYVFLGWTATSDGGTYPTNPTPPGGWGGDGGYYNQQEISA